MKILILILSLLFSGSALAQSQRNPCYLGVSGQYYNCVPDGINNPHPVTGNNNIPSYSAAVVALANVAAGDVYCISGSATKTIKVKTVHITATATAALIGDVSLVVRSTLDTNGGLTAVTITPNDPLDNPATASINSFTSAPTPGTTVGIIRAHKIAVGTQGNTAANTEAEFDFTKLWDQPLTLRGTLQSLCVNVSAFGTGAQFNIYSEHTEE